MPQQAEHGGPGALRRTTTVRGPLRGEAELRAVFDAGPDPILVIDSAGRVVDGNLALINALGISSLAQILGSRPDEFSPELQPDGRRSDEKAMAMISRALQNGHGQFEWVHRRQNGELFTVEVTLKRYDNDEPLLIVHWRDITERISIESALRASEAQHRLLADHASDIIWTMDPAARFTYVSPSVERLRGFTAEEVLADGLQGAVSPSSLGVAIAALDTARAQLEAGVPVKEVRLELEQPHKDGSTVWTESVVSPIYDASHKFAGFVGVTRDISERRGQEAEIRQLTTSLERRVEARTAELATAVAALEQALRVKDEFLSTMSHELRTPLMGVLNMAEALLAGAYGALNDRQRRGLEIVQASGRQLLELMNDILDLSKISSGILELHAQPFLMSDLCRACLAHAGSLAGAKQLELAYHVEPPDMIIQADPLRLKQLLNNLLSNAVKFTPEGGRIDLIARRSPTGHELTVDVRDTGIGISPDDLGGLFVPFSQIDRRLSRGYSGTGLGLALVRRLAELHGGTVSVNSTPGEGSVFTVTIPQE
ncbi:MAG: PAS domain S-box protein [Caldilinea sp.]|nr:PAS domain S-box protein [Caldilinea sp.]